MRQLILAPICPDDRALLMIEIEESRPNSRSNREIDGHGRLPNSPFLGYERDRFHALNP